MPIFDLFPSSISPDFLLNLLSIILIDLVLAGDNSIVIAMAVQSLDKKTRLKGIIGGALAAVVLRVIFTFFASQMLTFPFVKLGGGILILWIAIKLMVNKQDEDLKGKKANSIWTAVWIILVADITMSLDNILAVAGASHGSLSLLLFGLGLSIPLVVFASTVISQLMGKFPVIMWIGAIILGKVGGEMIITDPIIVSKFLSGFHLTELKNGLLEANHYVIWSMEIFMSIMVLFTALLLRRPKKATT